MAEHIKYHNNPRGKATPHGTEYQYPPPDFGINESQKRPLNKKKFDKNFDNIDWSK